MRRLLLSLAAATALAAAAGGQALAYSWGVDPKESAITFSGQHEGKTFEGRFESWDATVDFDPKAPEAATVLVTIDMSSARTGNALYDGTLPGADWFNVEAYPQARFEAFGAAPDGAGGYSLAGKLTIRSNSVPVTLTFRADGERAEAHSTVTLQRMDFAIGAQTDPNGAAVSLEIPVTVTLVARPSAQ